MGIENPLADGITAREKQTIFGSFTFANFFGRPRMVEFTGADVKLEHGFGFAPDVEEVDLVVTPLTPGLIAHVVSADETHVTIGANVTGRARVLATVEPRSSR